jgi:hypothetical protein
MECNPKDKYELLIPGLQDYPEHAEVYRFRDFTAVQVYNAVQTLRGKVLDRQSHLRKVAGCVLCLKVMLWEAHAWLMCAFLLVCLFFFCRLKGGQGSGFPAGSQRV